MNKVEGYPSLMIIMVNGVSLLRPAHKEIRKDSFTFGGVESFLQLPRWVPKLYPGERLCEVVGGEMFIVTEFSTTPFGEPRS